MIIRASTAFLLASLYLAAPSYAAFDADVLAGGYGTGATASGGGMALEPELSQVLADATRQPVRSPAREIGEGEQMAALADDALAPELFLDPHEAETLAWIAKDLAAAGELATGSVFPSAPDPSPSFPLEDEARFAFAEDPAVGALRIPSDLAPSPDVELHP